MAPLAVPTLLLLLVIFTFLFAFQASGDLETLDVIFIVALLTTLSIPVLPKRNP